MTTEAAPRPGENPESSPIPFDLYREVHKGLRLALFRLVERIGSADHAAAGERGAAVEHVQRVSTLLAAHHRHEDSFVQPLVRTHAPMLATAVDEGHAETDAHLAEVDRLVDVMAGSAGVDAVAAGLDLYRSLSLLTSSFLAHLAVEEGAVMSALRDAMSVAELQDVEMAIRLSVPPFLMCDFISVMAPAMNIDERADMLGGMQAGAPAEMFELFRSAAEAALDPEQYHAVAARIGLG